MAEIATWSMINSKTGMVHRALTVLQNQKYYLTIDYMWKEATPIINLFK